MIYISFDTEEFDLPREKWVDYNVLKEGMLVSSYGVECVLKILSEESVKATFFVRQILWCLHQILLKES